MPWRKETYHGSPSNILLTEILHLLKYHFAAPYLLGILHVRVPLAKPRGRLAPAIPKWANSVKHRRKLPSPIPRNQTLLDSSSLLSHFSLTLVRYFTTECNEFYSSYELLAASLCCLARCGFCNLRCFAYIIIPYKCHILDVLNFWTTWKRSQEELAYKRYVETKLDMFDVSLSSYAWKVSRDPNFLRTFSGIPLVLFGRSAWSQSSFLRVLDLTRRRTRHLS